MPRPLAPRPRPRPRPAPFPRPRPRPRPLPGAAAAGGSSSDGALLHSLPASSLPLCTSDSRSSRSAKSSPSTTASRSPCASRSGVAVGARGGSSVAPPEAAACVQHYPHYCGLALGNTRSRTRPWVSSGSSQGSREWLRRSGISSIGLVHAPRPPLWLGVADRTWRKRPTVADASVSPNNVDTVTTG